jgi:hypothetical protein
MGGKFQILNLSLTLNSFIMKNLKYILVLVFLISLVNISWSQKQMHRDHRTSKPKTTKKVNTPLNRTDQSIDHRAKSSTSNSSTGNRSTTSPRPRPAMSGKKEYDLKKQGYVFKDGRWERAKKVPQDVTMGAMRNKKALSKMKEMFTALNHTNDVWVKDSLLIVFEKNRRLKIDRKYLDYYNLKEEFNQLCDDFDQKYNNQNKVLEMRKVKDMNILVEGKISELSNRPFQYFPLPNQAKLLTVYNKNTGEQNALGFIQYHSTGKSNLTLSIDVALNFNEQKVSEAKDSLSGYGIKLNNKFPSDLVEIKEQGIKVKGLAGNIIPLGQCNFRIEFSLPDENLSLLKLFTGPIEFNLDYSVDNKLKPQSQTLSLEVDQSILDQFNPQAVLESFSTIESNSISDFVKVSSLLDASRTKEEALNRVDVILEFQFQNQTIVHGPFRLSSHGTLASDQTVQFLKHSDEYQIKVTGKAYYENGTRDIKKFLTTDQIILITEDSLR